MITQFFLIIFTAMVTSALTLVAAWCLYQYHLKTRLEIAIDEKAEELGERLKDQVREGVQEGIRDGVSDLPTDLVGKATKGVAKIGIDMIEDGMRPWFRSSKSRRDE